MPSDRKKVKQWGKKSQGVKGLPTTGQLVKAERKKEAAVSSHPWTMQEKIQCLELYADLKDPGQVAIKLKRTEESVRKFISRYQSSTKGARMVLEAGAMKLAENVIKNANVDESLEVLDRLDILNRKRDKTLDRPTHSILIVGMPGNRADNPIPLPSQKQIEDAIDAKATVVNEPPIPIISDSLDDVNPS